MALAGAAVASVLFPMLLVSVTLDLIGWVENPYFSFLLYLALTPLLIIAIILTAVGIFRSGGESSYSFESFKEHLHNPCFVIPVLPWSCRGFKPEVLGFEQLLRQFLPRGHGARLHHLQELPPFTGSLRSLPCRQKQPLVGPQAAHRPATALRQRD
jgi:hypothetical protein